MKRSVLYRVASGLLFLFAVAHTFGFMQVDPSWGVGAVIRAMQASQFTIQGFTRTYWDFFLGSGFTVGVLYLFAAVLAWQLSGLPNGLWRPCVPQRLASQLALSRSRHGCLDKSVSVTAERYEGVVETFV